MSITLPTEIISSDKTPRTAVAIDKTSGVKQVATTAREVLLVGQMLSTATVAASIPTPLLREDDGGNYFGARSIIDIACRAAFKANPFVKLSAVGITEAGVAAAQTVTFATTATGNTIYRLYIGGKEVAIDITSTDTADTIGGHLATAINSTARVLPVLAVNATGTVTITAKNGGTIGNGIKLSGAFDAFVATTATIGASSLAAGTGSASTTAALAAATGKRYHEIAILIDDSTAGAVAKTSVNSESDGEHGHGETAWQALNSTQSNNTTLALALNGNRNVLCSINASPSWSVEICAAAAAAASREEVATRPLNTMVLNGILPPPVESRWTRTETRTLLDNGCTPLVVLPGEQVAFLRVVTTGVKNSSGDFDYSTLDVTKWRGLDFLRDNLVLMFNTNYSVARWADSDPDGLLPSDVATPEKVGIDILNVLRDMESLGITQNVEKYADEIVVEKRGSACYFSCPAVIVDGMHEKLGKIVYKLA